MPLTLVTGPANAAKAGEVLGGLRARLEEDPILLVPAYQDVEHSQRELAAHGAVFGAQVVRFEWLFRRIAERVGHSARVASELQRELVVQEAVRRARLSVLAESAAQAGFARAALRFVRELERSMVEVGDLEGALRRWAGRGPRRTYADEVAAIYRLYREGLDAAGLADPELFAWRALEALRREPGRWGRTPVFAYGFDDLTELELYALETLAGRCEAQVTVSLPFEPGRAAFKAVSEVFGRLAASAAEHRPLEPLSDHYADDSRAALHHLERSLFELDVHRADPGPAVRLHSAGGERAEVELVGAEVLGLLRAGTAPGDVAVVFRDPGRYASLVEQVFDAYGIPFSIDRSLPFAHTALGRGLLALLRSAVLPAGSADDLLAWLRAPGMLDTPGLADWLEAEVRREGARSAAQARAVWERERWPLEELDRLREAPDLVAALDRALQRLFARPYERRAVVLSGPELDDARAFDAAHDALRELHALASTGMAFDPHRVHEVLAELPVRVGENPQPDRVQVADPGGIRARRFEAVFVCGLQEGEFPRGAAPEPFLPDEDRRAIAAASGLVLPMREDQLDRERYLFYVCASRAERVLALSSRYCDEEGDPEAQSFFVEDVRDLFEEIPTRRRSLSDVTWAPDAAPTAAEYERALALRGPRREQPEPTRLRAEPLLEDLAAQEAVSAGALEHYADCPVKWLVEDVLRPVALEPDPEAMVRGRYAHRVLERTYARLREATGDRRVTRENLPEAERILLDELGAGSAEFQMSPDRTRVRAAARRLEFDLLRYLAHEAESDGLFEPEHLELGFGMNGGEPVELAEGVRVRGVIDRIDVWERYALVRDYKSGKSADSYKVASWEKENRFQAALYMLAVQELLGLEPAGGVYVPLGDEKLRARGMVTKGLEAVGSGFARNDRLGREEFASRLEWARGKIAETVASMRDGELGCSPETCGWDGHCSHPSICRTEE